MTTMRRRHMQPHWTSWCHMTIWSFNRTFNLTNMYVTVSTYQNLTLNYCHTGNAPVFFRLMFIHDQSDSETDDKFFSSLASCLQTMNFHELRLGSDDQYAVCKAVGILLPGCSAASVWLTSKDKHTDVRQRCCHVTVDVLHFRASHLYGKSVHYRVFRATEPQKLVDSWRKLVSE